MVRDGDAQAIRDIPYLPNRAHRRKTLPYIGGHGPRMVGSAGVDGHAPGGVRPGEVEGGAKQRRAQAGADRVGEQAEVAQVHHRGRLMVQLEEADGFVVAVEHVDRHARQRQQRTEVIDRQRAP